MLCGAITSWHAGGSVRPKRNELLAKLLSFPLETSAQLRLRRFFMIRTLVPLSVFGAILLFAPAASAQKVEQPVPADSPSQTEPSNPPASEQPVEAPSPNLLRPGTKAEAEHSAEVTARKSVSDPNNQRGTSLQGRTRPIAGADVAVPDATTLATAEPNASPESATVAPEE